MFVRGLELTDFRSWHHLALALSPGITVFVGRNGNGKTNLVEAVGYLSTLSSHRVSGEAPLLRENATAATVSATVVNRGRELTVAVDLNAGTPNRARINGAGQRRPRDILGVLRTVTFAPEDLALVRGEPAERRRYLDETATALRPTLAATRADYDKVLRQRNALLKSAGAAVRRGGSAADSMLGTLSAWDEQLVEHGSRLVGARLALLHALDPELTAAYAALAPDSRPASLRYRTGLAEMLPPELLQPAHEPTAADLPVIADALALAVAGARERELDRGISLVGPHRDDLDLVLGTSIAKGFASHGESWSFALSLRLASFALYRQVDSDPVLILDDVFAELDAKRRRALSAFARDVEQVLVTAAVEEDIPEDFARAIFRVTAVEGDDGRVSMIEEVR